MLLGNFKGFGAKRCKLVLAETSVPSLGRLGFAIFCAAAVLSRPSPLFLQLEQPEDRRF